MSYNNDIWLNLVHENCNNRDCLITSPVNNQTLDNLSSIKPNLTNSFNDFKYQNKNGKVNKFSKVNPNLQNFLLNKGINKISFNTIDEKENSNMHFDNNPKNEAPVKNDANENNNATPDLLLFPRYQITPKRGQKSPSPSKSFAFHISGIFNKNGDFLFSSDQEILKTHEYFVLFYQNRKDFTNNK